MGLGTGRSLPFINILHLLPGKTHLQLLHSLAASWEHPAAPHVHMQHCRSPEHKMRDKKTDSSIGGIRNQGYATW